MKVINQLVSTGLHLSQIPKNVYGVEVELEGHDEDTACSPLNDNYWATAHDDSLRNGVEFISIPLTQLQLQSAFKSLQTLIDKKALIANKRCSIHVHMNARNMTWGQLWGLIGLYTFLEPDIFKRFAPERDENHFCVPMYWNTTFIDRLAEDIGMLRELDVSLLKKPTKKPTRKKQPLPMWGAEVATSMPSLSSLSHNKVKLLTYLKSVGISSLKYSSLSLFRLSDLGTVEFRTLPGTTEMEKAAEWVRFLGRLKHVAMKYKDPLDIQALYEDIGRTRLWRMLQMGTLPAASAQDRQEAEEASCKLIGSNVVDKDDLTWDFK